jgi:hypothetical protein
LLTKGKQEAASGAAATAPPGDTSDRKATSDRLDVPLTDKNQKK